MSKEIKTKYPEVSEIREDLESLKGNTVELAHHVKDDTVESVEETVLTLKKQTQKELKKVESHVKDNPIQSVAIAFAGGILASMLIRSRR
tara:strand:- start:8236 stop:8505 length:270 start_codon:yes stop_codon:yes gene_type:complete